MIDTVRVLSSRTAHLNYLASIPRYVRVNTNLSSQEEVVSDLTSRGFTLSDPWASKLVVHLSVVHPSLKSYRFSGKASPSIHTCPISCAFPPRLRSTMTIFIRLERSFCKIKHHVFLQSSFFLRHPTMQWSLTPHQHQEIRPPI